VKNIGRWTRSRDRISSLPSCRVEFILNVRLYGTDHTSRGMLFSTAPLQSRHQASTNFGPRNVRLGVRRLTDAAAYERVQSSTGLF